MEPMAITYSAPMLKSWPIMRRPNGMTVQSSAAPTKIRIGARLKSGRSALSGMMSSLISIFTASAIAWKMPHGPTRFGPRRFWMRPMTLRSIQVRVSVAMTGIITRMTPTTR